MQEYKPPIRLSLKMLFISKSIKLCKCLWLIIFYSSFKCVNLKLRPYEKESVKATLFLKFMLFVTSTLSADCD